MIVRPLFTAVAMYVLMAYPLCAQTQAQAQGALLARVLRPDQTQSMRIDGVAGDIIRVTARSSTFDTVLRVAVAGDTLFNDDSDFGTDSQLVILVPDSVNGIVATVSPYSPGGEGFFELEWERLTGNSSTRMFATGTGRTIKGEAYAPVPLPADTPVEWLAHLPVIPGVYAMVAQSDGGERMVAQPSGVVGPGLLELRLDAIDDERWRLDILFDTVELGRFPEFDVRLTPLRATGELRDVVGVGNLEVGDSLEVTGEHYDVWAVEEPRGRYAFELRSHDFEPYLALRWPDGRETRDPRAESGFGVGHASRVEAESREGGSGLRLIVTSQFPGETGEYEIVLRRLPDREPEVRRLEGLPDAVELSGPYPDALLDPQRAEEALGRTVTWLCEYREAMDDGPLLFTCGRELQVQVETSEDALREALIATAGDDAVLRGSLAEAEGGVDGVALILTAAWAMR